MRMITNHFNTRRVQSGGLKTTATVTNVETWNVLFSASHRYGRKIRHITTFEYQAGGQTIIVERNSDHYNLNARPLHNVGELVEIYYDGLNPYNFVFAYSSSFGIFMIVLGLFILLGIPIVFVMLKTRRKILRTTDQGNERP